jgi:hypothetical protein
MISIREHIILLREEGSSRVHHIDARKVVFLSNLLSPYMLLDSNRVVGSRSETVIVSDDHALPSIYHSNTCDNVT